MSMIEWWQHIPEYLNPIAFTVGFFSVYWYALLWVLGFVGALWFAIWYAKKEGGYGTKEHIQDLFSYLFLGAFLGGRLGYILLYRPDIFLNDPARIILPYDFQTDMYVGISGMSFHGGLLGVAVALFLFARKRNLDFLRMADLVALSAPIALFFGRIGNFVNLELYGRVTTKAWGMYFPYGVPVEVLRHPSALYESIVEGVILFLLLFFLRHSFKFSGGLAAGFFVCYGIIRFVVEYVREPDEGISLIANVFTRGQAFSGLMVLMGGIFFIWLQIKNHDKIVTKSSSYDGRG